MGNPLSPVLAEIFMDEIESKIHNNPLSSNFIYWYRYVDDIITCFTGTNRQLDTFVNFINGIHPKIHFTMEMEEDNKINFLDLTLNKVNGKHDFSIFRKPSHTDTVIHNRSLHPYQHKLAAFHSMVHRLISVEQTEENFNKELNIIRQIATNNGYKTLIVDQILQKKLYNKAINEVFPRISSSDRNYSTISYYGRASERISSFLKKQNIQVAFKTNNCLGKYIKNNKEKRDRKHQSGIYKLNCGSCPKVYVGQTGRTFEARTGEHKKSFLNQKN